MISHYHAYHNIRPSKLSNGRNVNATHIQVGLLLRVTALEEAALLPSLFSLLPILTLKSALSDVILTVSWFSEMNGILYEIPGLMVRDTFVESCRGLDDYIYLTCRPHFVSLV